MRRRVGTSLYAGFLFAVLGLVAWASGQPFVFPSLGPSAFVLAFERRIDRTERTVVGSHAIGALAGLVAYSLLAEASLSRPRRPDSRSTACDSPRTGSSRSC